MIFDALTITTIAVSILVVVLVFAAIYYSHINTYKNMRTLGQRTIMLSADDEIRDLCKKIVDKDPKACPLMDHNLHNTIVHDPDTLKKMLRQQLSSLGG